MVRILGVVVSDNYKITYALTKIYGIGWPTAKDVVKKSGVQESVRIGELSEDALKKVVSMIDKNYRVEGNLREYINDNLKRLRDIRCYRGWRHTMGLPVRGQRTRSNARTNRGKRRTVGALTKEAWAKLEQNQSKK
jgi:small subunit ribosomal protein S13